MLNPTTKDDLKKRLRRIEGQVRGVEKMLDDDRECREILQQLTAVKSAVQQASLIVARSYACQCLEDSTDGKNQTALVDELMSALSK